MGSVIYKVKVTEQPLPLMLLKLSPLHNHPLVPLRRCKRLPQLKIAEVRRVGVEDVCRCERDMATMKAKPRLFTMESLTDQKHVACE